MLGLGCICAACKLVKPLITVHALLHANLWFPQASGVPAESWKGQTLLASASILANPALKPDMGL